MSQLWWAIALVLLLTIVAGVVYVTTRPGGADSVLAALLFGTTGVALVLVLGQALDLARTVDIALVLALLAAVLGVAFVLRGWPEDDSDENPKP
jgi:multicomponent Na+:H+ antiporter subunit F